MKTYRQIRTNDFGNLAERLSGLMEDVQKRRFRKGMLKGWSRQISQSFCTDAEKKFLFDMLHDANELVFLYQGLTYERPLQKPVFFRGGIPGKR